MNGSYGGFTETCKKENEAVDRIKTVILEKMINQFQTQILTDLLNVSTEELASTLQLIIARENCMQILKDVQESRRSKSAQYPHKDILAQKATYASSIEENTENIWR